MKIRGLSFSLKRAIGITAAKQGLERKVGKIVLDSIFGSKKK